MLGKLDTFVEIWRMGGLPEVSEGNTIPTGSSVEAPHTGEVCKDTGVEDIFGDESLATRCNPQILRFNGAMFSACPQCPIWLRCATAFFSAKCLANLSFRRISRACSSSGVGSVRHAACGGGNCERGCLGKLCLSVQRSSISLLPLRHTSLSCLRSASAALDSVLSDFDEVRPLDLLLRVWRSGITPIPISLTAASGVTSVASAHDTLSLCTSARLAGLSKAVGDATLSKLL
mmetsp:Transcript_87834/g.221073  ORF Transcript_87834/g.221073 Transcript_87834/m.221073 type:complete len:232 (+) Transcript_87834:345-1040(+)